MPDKHSSFSQWRKRLLQSPDEAVDGLLAKIEQLPPPLRQALVAAWPDRTQLLRRVQLCGTADDDGPLVGVPYALQDMFDAADLPTRCGSHFPEALGTTAEVSSDLVQHLESIGSPLFLKTTPAQFGVDLAGRNTRYGTCPNALGEHYLPGGGAGTAVRAVKDGIVPLAFGLDSIGGMRVPIAFQGLFGFRMEFGYFARNGLFPLTPSVESVGWATASLDDLVRTFEALYPHVERRESDCSRGLLLEEISPGTAPDVKSSLLRLSRELDIVEDPGRIRMLRQALHPADRALRIIEGHEQYFIHRFWMDEHGDEYDEWLHAQLLEATESAPGDLEDAANIQIELRAGFAEVFEDFDFVVLPVSPVPSPTFNDWSVDLERDIKQLIAPASLVSAPTIVLPLACANRTFCAAQIILSPAKLHVFYDIAERLFAHYDAVS